MPARSQSPPDPCPDAPGRTDLLSLPPTIPVQAASRIFGIGKNRTYTLIRQGKYPIPVIDIDGQHRCSRVDLLRRLGYPEDVILGRAS